MIEPLNLVTESTARKLLELIGRTPGAGDQRPARAGARGRMPVIVRCTSITPAGGSSIGSQAYPAVMIAGHGTQSTQPEQTAVWLTVLGPGTGGTPEAPVLDQLYHGYFAGDFDPGSNRRPRVFAVTPAVSIAAGGVVWVKVATKTYAQLAVAATVNDIEVYSLPAKGVIHGAIIKHTAAFGGGAISSYTLSVGVALTEIKYTSSGNVFGTPGDTVFTPNGGSTLNPQPEDFGAATSIRLWARSGSANLDQATAGSVDVWLCLGTLPA